MHAPSIVTAEQAARLMSRTTTSVIVGGNGGTGAPEAVLVALEERFLADAAAARHSRSFT